MSGNTCTTCLHSRRNTGRIIMCYRPKRFASGRVSYPSEMGFSALIETHETSFEGRADGDVCGPDRVHWEPRPGPTL
jgi:hypothetical protein